MAWCRLRPSTRARYATTPLGNWDPVLGRSYVQIARQGWGEQKSQNGGANPTLSGPGTARYHLWAVAPRGSRKAAGGDPKDDLFSNHRVDIDTSLEGLAGLAPSAAWLAHDLKQIDIGLDELLNACPCKAGQETAHRLSPLYRQTLDLRAKVAASDLDAE